MICRVCDHSDRHTCLIFRPVVNRGEAAQEILVRLSNRLSQRVPFGIVDCLDQPTVFPIDAFGTAAYEFAKPVEIELRVLGLSGDRCTGGFARCIGRAQAIERIEDSDAAIEIRAGLALG